jgi:2-amino-4-hydroxy-6-hydroxymethyldihydropteridine diphosphokinase
MSIIYISLGSNINREANTRAGINALRQTFGELQLSSVYESESVGFDGDAFFNMVIACDVDLPVHETNRVLREIEDANERDRTGPKFSSRTLDLDLLLYDDLVLNEKGLVLPRGEILKNAFVLWPLAEIVPDLRHPVNGKTYNELWSEFDKTKENLKPIVFDFDESSDERVKISSIDSIACDLYVDISGTDCAIPFSKLSDALDVLLPEQTLMAVSKKQALQSDIPAFCRLRNLQLVEQGEADGMFYFLIKNKT